MSDIVRIFALGGLDENGKNMYVVEINDDIFKIEYKISKLEKDLKKNQNIIVSLPS